LVDSARLKYHYHSLRSDTYALCLKIYILYLYYCLERTLVDASRESQLEKLPKVLSNLMELASYMAVMYQRNPDNGFIQQLSSGLTLLTHALYPVVCEKVLVIIAGVIKDGKPSPQSTSGLLTTLFDSLRLFRNTMTKEIFRPGANSTDDTLKTNHAILGRWFSRVNIMLYDKTIKKDVFKNATKNLQALELNKLNKNRISTIAKATHALDTLCEKSNKDSSLDFYHKAMQEILKAREAFVSNISIVTQSKKLQNQHLTSEIIDFMNYFYGIQIVFINRAIKSIMFSLYSDTNIKSIIPKLTDSFKVIEKHVKISEIYPENIQGPQLDFTELHIKTLRMKVWSIELLTKKPMPDTLCARDILAFLFSKQGSIKNEYEACLSPTMKTYLCDMLVSLVNEYVLYSKSPIPENANAKAQQNLNTRTLNAAKQILKILNKTFSDEGAAKTCLEEHKSLVPNAQPKKKKRRNNRKRKNKKKTKKLAHGKNGNLVWNSKAEGGNASSNKNSKAENKQGDHSNNNNTQTGAATPGNSSEVNE